jgi:anaerobic magnesium-protoporphyrin IX monomethyl ester cyclase
VRAPEDTQVLLVSAMRRDEYAAQSPRRRAAGDLGIRYVAAVLSASGVRADVLPDHQNTPAALEQRLRAARGLVLVGFSLHTSTLAGGLAGIAACRRVRPDVPVAIGGYHPTFAVRALDQAGVGADYVVRGEGETPTVALVEALARGDDQRAIRGIRGVVALGGPVAGARLGDEQRGFPQDLDALPLPLRTADDMPRDTAEVMVSASRGCYGSCTFCSVPVFGRAGWRGRDPNRVADEVDLLARHYGTRFVDFVDDSLFGPRGGDERARALQAAFASRDLKIPFRASIRPNDVNAERIALLKECGLAAVQLGWRAFRPGSFRRCTTSPAPSRRHCAPSVSWSRPASTSRPG